MQRKELGIAVIGSGRIGTLRAILAAQHPAVKFLAVSDRDPARAEMLAVRTGAQFHSSDNLSVISRPEVNAVVVSTIELEHTLPVLQALALGKPVLVEKPLALNLAEADKLISAVAKAGGDLRVGYSRRYKDRYLLAKEQVLQGRLGRLTGGAARVYNSRSQAMQTLKRLPENSSVSGLTYYIDVMNWLLEGNPAVEVFARGQGSVLKGSGHNTNDVTWAIVTFADGAVVNFGVCYALPQHYPSLGHAARVELLGTEGVMILDDDHTDQIMYSNVGVPHVYIPDHNVNMVFLGSGTPGDWALGEFQGPVASETRAWLDYLSTGRPCVLATPEDARKALEVARAIELSLQSGTPVRLPLTY
ncbi:MAG: Gfo/Idh/MocA family oxidoreductase [Burkholderiales bacterium]